MTGIPAIQQRRRRSPAAHGLSQNAPLLLGVGLLVLMVAIYLGLYGNQIGRLPGNFELTSTADNALPLVFAALGQSLVILTGGIDLSVGGVMDLTNSVSALEMHGSTGHMLLWAVLIAFGRLQPILVTLGSLAIFQGLALKVLPQPGGQVAGGVTSTLANPHEGGRDPWSRPSPIL